MMGILNHLSTLLLLSLLPPALSHVVDKFSDVPQCQKFFLEGTTPNLPGILVGGTVKDQNRYKPICQLYNNAYRFATLYDTTNKIPVLSAYTFTGYIPGRPAEPWMMEPGLEENNNKINEMQSMGGGIYKNQAGNNDYAQDVRRNPKDFKDVSRGHLFPSSHARDLKTQESTFTLTNIVPQDRTFNGGSWREMEERVREKLEMDCISNKGITAYVVTGAVPSSSNKLNNRVNIPDLLWTAFCCLDKKKKWMAEAHWGWNKKDKGETLKPETLGALEDMLNRYHQGKDGPVKVFPGDCPRDTKPTTSS
ncbi:endonuclease domain-containing 1 protein-like [Oncorhynchus kisutch]|uniref:Endonuclease domain-containing 1 protein-like n=1 Tax=Oncorhynchus kisutch TaxID=8019 RepID=A0A8C7HI27_ONCKI|nr:endonuclease domain-containing 1 protein-like [Oncorhynchus kisutch]